MAFSVRIFAIAWRAWRLHSTPGTDRTILALGVAALVATGMRRGQLLHLAGELRIRLAATAGRRVAQHTLIRPVRLLQVEVLGDARLQQSPLELLLQQAP